MSENNNTQTKFKIPFIGEQTSISIALVITLIAGAFYTGVLANKISDNSNGVQDLGNVVIEIQKLSETNQTRINYLEKLLELERNQN